MLCLAVGFMLCNVGESFPGPAADEIIPENDFVTELIEATSKKSLSDIYPEDGTLNLKQAGGSDYIESLAKKAKAKAKANQGATDKDGNPLHWSQYTKPIQHTLSFAKELKANGATVSPVKLPKAKHYMENPPTCAGQSTADLKKLCGKTECANWMVCGRHNVHHGSDGKDCTYCPRKCFYCECAKRVQDDAHTTSASQQDHMYSCDMTPYDTAKFCPLNCVGFDKCKGNGNKPCKSFPRRCVQCECLKKGYPTDYGESIKFHKIMRKKDDPLGIKGHKGEHELELHALDGKSTKFWPWA